MSRIDRRAIVMPGVLLAAAACQPIRSHSDVQTERIEDARATFGSYFTDMSDNAIQSDGSIADIHFVPHTTELSGLGVQRLDRMAKLLDTYGGTVRYETTLADSPLVKERMDHVREYLTLSGCDMARVTVAVARPGGTGMPGDEAVRKFNEGTAPKTDAGTTLLQGGGSGSSSNR